MRKKDDKVGNKKGSAQCEKIDKRGKEGEKERWDRRFAKKGYNLPHANAPKKKWLDWSF